jgi:hypothetical protein
MARTKSASFRSVSYPNQGIELEWKAEYWYNNRSYFVKLKHNALRWFRAFCVESLNISMKPMRIRLRIRIQHFFFNADPDTGFDDQNLEQIYSRKKIIFIWSNIAFYLSLGLHKGRPSYIRSLHPSEENISHFKITWIFFPFVGLFGPPGSGSRSSRPKWMRIRIRNTAQESTNSWLERSLTSEWNAHHAAMLGVHLVALSTLPARLGAGSRADIRTRLQ